ncbi:MAG: uracil-DNA glycosylase [Armatimonadota bacterium]
MIEETAQSPADTLAFLAGQIRLCRNCDLCLKRRQAVPGEGNPQARILFVGEGPGATEDELGRPFVGAAGQFLDEMLADIGLNRADVFIGNVTKCRPPGNRDPQPEEIEACAPWLQAQIAAIRPRVICTLGRFAMNALISPTLQISKAHGQPVEKDDILYLPLFHPAAALHQESLKRTLIEDMRKVREILTAKRLW